MADATAFLKPDWPAPPNVRAAMTTREGGCSTGPYASLNLGQRCGDDAVAVTRNRARLMRALGLPREPQWLDQVHGCTVLQAPFDGSAEADGIWTQAPLTPCAVMTADCLPVLFCDVGGEVVAAAHAGWRGLAGGVLEAAVAALPVPPSTLLAWLGPAIGSTAFEVGPEVRAAFIERHAAARAAFTPGRRPDSFMADLYALARLRLADAGVVWVGGGDCCTHTESQRFFSYRRDGVTGRMAAMVWLDGS